MRTCRSLTLGLLCLAGFLAIGGVAASPMLQNIKDAGPIAMMFCLVGPMIFLLLVGITQVRRNEPSYTGGFFSLASLAVLLVIIAGLYLLFDKWMGGVK